MKCKEIDSFFRKNGDWVNWNKTRDGFKAGNSLTYIRKIAVVWKPTMESLIKAYELGANLIISHEGITVKAPEYTPQPEIEYAIDAEKNKFNWVKKHNIVIYRCHDYWDGFPQKGIRWAWQKGLNLKGKIIADNFPLLITKIEPVTLRELAKYILKQIKSCKQNGVLVTGNMNKKVSKVATGTGVTKDPVKMLELGADVGILTDDYYRFVKMGSLAAELDFPTIIVNHGVSEEWGIKNLASYLRDKFSQIDVFYIKQYCPYKIITG